jgi:hypothetical protein
MTFRYPVLKSDVFMEEMHGQEVDMTPNGLSPTEETEVYLQVAQVTWWLSLMKYERRGDTIKPAHATYEGRTPIYTSLPH